MKKECPNCKSKNIIAVEYAYGNPKYYDGISEIDCHDCEKRYGRWCGKELGKEEAENVFCRGESHE